MPNHSIKPNFESIDYNVRPGKCVERKMLCELFNRMSAIDKIQNFRYIGFGSAYFTDFKLFHNQMGIRKMLSIEKEVAYKKRINFNKPQSCIDVEYGDSSTILPSLPWSRWKEKSIVWLDYTQNLQEYMLTDINTLVTSVKPGSYISISINVSAVKDTRKEKIIPVKEWRANELSKRIGSPHMTDNSKKLPLNTKNNIKVIREIIDNTIRKALLTRNGGVRTEDKLLYVQLINIAYKDGADMLTVGGIIHSKKQQLNIDKMHLTELNFVSKDEKCFMITIPKLTFKEINALDKYLPNNKYRTKSLPLNPVDIENYSKIYRYFPTFSETTF